jgi:zinc protease
LQLSTTSDVAKFVLPNGLTILLKENHATNAAAVLAHVNVGYFNEPDRWNGIAHVVEHMFFKGTSNRPGKEQVAEEIRALGGSINAGTYYDETSYYTVLPAAGIERAIEIQADTFQNSLFDADELAKELEVIIQESKQKRDNPSAMLVETMYANAFDSHRIRRWRIGPDEVLRSLRHEDLAQFVQQTYRPENIVLSIVGDIDPEKTLEWIRRYWQDMPRGELIRESSPVEPERTGFRFNQKRGDIQQRLVNFGFHAPHILHEDAEPLLLIGTI